MADNISECPDPGRSQEDWTIVKLILSKAISHQEPIAVINLAEYFEQNVYAYEGLHLHLCLIECITCNIYISKVLLYLEYWVTSRSWLPGFRKVSCEELNWRFGFLLPQLFSYFSSYNLWLFLCSKLSSKNTEVYCVELKMKYYEHVNKGS